MCKDRNEIASDWSKINVAYFNLPRGKSSGLIENNVAMTK